MSTEAMEGVNLLQMNNAYDHDNNETMDYGKAAYTLHIAQSLRPRPAVLVGRKVDGLVFLEQPNGKYERGKLDEKDSWVTSGGNRAYTLECTTGGRQVILWRARGWLQRSGIAEKQRFSVYVLGDKNDPPRKQGGRQRSTRKRLYHIETARKPTQPLDAPDPELSSVTGDIVAMAEALPTVHFADPVSQQIPRPSNDWKRKRLEEEIASDSEEVMGEPVE